MLYPYYSEQERGWATEPRKLIMISNHGSHKRRDAVYGRKVDTGTVSFVISFVEVVLIDHRGTRHGIRSQGDTGSGDVVTTRLSTSTIGYRIEERQYRLLRRSPECATSIQGDYYLNGLKLCCSSLSAAGCPSGHRLIR